MSRIVDVLRLSLVLAGSGAGVVGLADAQETPSTEPSHDAAPTANPILAPKPAAAPQPEHARAVSPETAARLAALAPKFSDPAKPTAPKTDIEELDKPRNGIIRLPRYIVQEPREHLPSPYQAMTPKAKLELARKLSPGLAIGSLPFLNNDGVALEILEENMRVARAHEASDLLSLSGGKAATTDRATRELIRDVQHPTSSPGQMEVARQPGGPPE